MKSAYTYLTTEPTKPLKKTKIIRKLTAYGLFSIFLVLLFLFSYIHYTSKLMEITDLKHRKSQEYLALKNMGKDLQTEVQSLQDPKYVSELARRDYYYSNEDEIIFVLPK